MDDRRTIPRDGAAIHAMEGRGLLAVEMEAAALYAFAQARRRRVMCFAHVTNQMGREEGDFEKGEADGAVAALELITRASRVLLSGDRGQVLSAASRSSGSGR